MRGNRLQALKVKGSISIGVDGYTRPSSLHEQDELIGFEFEFAKALAATIGVEASLKSMAFASVLTEPLSSSAPTNGR